MLHRKHSSELICITQPTHAWVAGQLARAWGNDRFGSLSLKKYAWAQSSMTLAGIDGKAHQHLILQPAILTALPNFQQQ